jgi:hypothetical protein
MLDVRSKLSKNTTIQRIGFGLSYSQINQTNLQPLESLFYLGTLI